MKPGRGDILFYCCIAMLASLFFSRAALSVTIIVFVAFSFFHTQIKEQLHSFFTTPLLWGMSLLFFLPLLSGLWSQDKTEWLEVIRIKLPLLFLPLAFASPFRFSKQQWKGLAVIFILLVTGGSLWSMFHYAANTAAVNEGYLKAKSLLTPLNNDHVRFSWMVTVSIILSGWLYFKWRLIKHSWLLLAVVGWLILYLHILAARTGLLSFYIAVLITACSLLFGKWKRWYGLLLLAGLLSLPVIAYYTMPSFNNRIRYMLYDFEYFKDTHYLPGGNDAMRMISIKAGCKLMQENPVIGIGFGDIKTGTNKWYRNSYPEMMETDKILPSSEWMIYGAGNGLPGLLLFTFVMLVPFFTRVKEKLPWWIISSTTALSFVADIGLEVQAGVFIYAFTILCWWKWLSPEKI